MFTVHKLVIASIPKLKSGDLFYHESDNHRMLGLRVSTPADGAQFFIKLEEDSVLSEATELFPVVGADSEAISFGQYFDVKLSDDLQNWHKNSDAPKPSYPSIALGESGTLYLIAKNAQGNRMCIKLETGELAGNYPSESYATISKSIIQTTAINGDAKILVVLN